MVLCCDVFYNIIDIWDVLQCRLLDYYRHFGATLWYSPVKTETACLRIVGGGVQTGSTRHRGHLLSYCACPG
jgi:hypothetical protein